MTNDELEKILTFGEVIKIEPLNKTTKLANILKTLPKEGKTLEEITKSSELNIHNAHFLLSFAISLGIIKRGKNKFYMV